MIVHDRNGKIHERSECICTKLYERREPTFSKLNKQSELISISTCLVRYCLSSARINTSYDWLRLEWKNTREKRVHLYQTARAKRAQFFSKLNEQSELISISICLVRYCMTSVVCLLSSAFCCLSSAICRLPSAVCRLPSAVCRLPSTVCPLPSVVCRLPSVVCHLPSSVCRIPSAVCRMPSARLNTSYDWIQPEL